MSSRTLIDVLNFMNASGIIMAMRAFILRRMPPWPDPKKKARVDGILKIWIRDSIMDSWDKQVPSKIEKLKERGVRIPEYLDVIREAHNCIAGMWYPGWGPKVLVEKALDLYKRCTELGGEKTPIIYRFIGFCEFLLDDSSFLGSIDKAISLLDNARKTPNEAPALMLIDGPEHVGARADILQTKFLLDKGEWLIEQRSRTPESVAKGLGLIQGIVGSPDERPDKNALWALIHAYSCTHYLYKTDDEFRSLKAGENLGQALLTLDRLEGVLPITFKAQLCLDICSREGFETFREVPRVRKTYYIWLYDVLCNEEFLTYVRKLGAGYEAVVERASSELKKLLFKRRGAPALIRTKWSAAAAGLLLAWCMGGTYLADRDIQREILDKCSEVIQKESPGSSEVVAGPSLFSDDRDGQLHETDFTIESELRTAEARDTDFVECYLAARDVDDQDYLF